MIVGTEVNSSVVDAYPFGELVGGVGVALGAAATAVYAHTKHWATIIPTEARAGGIAASLIIVAGAGLIPALRASCLSPTRRCRQSDHDAREKGVQSER